MELRQLKYFEKTCCLLNFTEAARALCISQSTLSQQIKQLETELGVLLFDRIGKRVVLTEAGEAFLPYVRKAIQETENARLVLSDLQNLETGLLRIGVTYSLSDLLTKALARFSASFPHIRVEITFATSNELVEKLENDEADFVLTFGSDTSFRDFDRQFLFSSRLYLVVNPSHPLASKPVVTFQDIVPVPLILPARGFATRSILDRVCREEGFAFDAKIELNDVQTIIDLVSSGTLGTVLSFSAVKGEDALVKIPIASDKDIVTKAYLLWSKGIYRKKAALRFAEILSQMTGRVG